MCAFIFPSELGVKNNLKYPFYSTTFNIDKNSLDLMVLLLMKTDLLKPV